MLLLEQAIAASDRNVERLVDDARELFEGGRFPSAYALAVLAARPCVSTRLRRA